MYADKNYFVNWTHVRVSKGEETSTEELLPSDFPMDISMGIFLVNGACERVQPTEVSNVVFEQVVLDL